MAISSPKEISGRGVVYCNNKKNCDIASAGLAQFARGVDGREIVACRCCHVPFSEELQTRESEPEPKPMPLKPKPEAVWASRAPLPQRDQDRKERTKKSSSIPPDYRFRFGATVRRLRKERSLTSEELGERCGGLLGYVIEEIERGARACTRIMHERIAGGFGINSAELRAHIEETQD